MKNQFEKYVNLIRKSAYFYSKRYGIEYDEVESQGYLIYCECLNNYDIAKGNFSTYLTWQLKELNHWCKVYLKQKGNLIEDYYGKNLKTDDVFSVTEMIPARRDDNPTLNDLLNLALNNLSERAYEVFKWILSWTWVKKGRMKPMLSTVVETFHCTRDEAKELWNEIGNFYRVSCVSL